MRSDESLPADSFRASTDWKRDPLVGEAKPEIDQRYSVGFEQTASGRRYHSFSGNERNHLFMNADGKSFRDLSTLSGIDNPADGRSFAQWDFNHDGKADIALVNANRPLLNIYRNTTDHSNSFVAVRLRGGNASSASSEEYSNRDAIGAVAIVECGEKTVLREMHAGEGFASQNSAVLLFGLGETPKEQPIDRLKIKWPSGRETAHRNIAQNVLVTAYENSSESRSGTGFDIDEYRAIESPPPRSTRRQRFHVDDSDQTARLHLYTSMATWCSACTDQIPQLHRLRDVFSQADLVIYGLASDPIETPEQLDRYIADHRPPYRLLLPSADQLAAFRKISKQRLLTEVIPTSVVTDRSGIVVEAFPGVPNVSDLRKLLSSE